MKTSLWLTVLGFLLLIPSLALNVLFYQKIKKTTSGIEVIAVLDGDTFVLEGKVRLRLRHIDAPELQFCGGQEAKKELERLVKDKKIVLEEQILDQRGRPMALVYVENILVNKEILESGWARYHHDKSSQAQILKNTADGAKEKQKGIFSPKCRQKENLQNPECLIKGNIDQNTGRKIYYFPGCAQYEFTIVEKDIGEDWFCSEEDAKGAGFVKSKTCFEKTYQ